MDKLKGDLIKDKGQTVILDASRVKLESMSIDDDVEDEDKDEDEEEQDDYMDYY